MNPTILMVDDDRDYSAILCAWLEPFYDVHAFPSGEEFLGALSKFVPEVVILDLYLPDVDGFELGRRLHAVPGLKTVPVLFLTGSELGDDYRKSMVAGGDTYLMKPVSRSQLLAAIAGLLPQPSMQDDGGGG